MHHFCCKTFTVIAWINRCDYWLLLQNFAPVLGWNFYGDYLTDYLPVLVWNFYGDCLTNCVRLMAFAAKVCTSSPVKLLRWLPDWLSTTYGFCCETLHHFCCKTFTVIAWINRCDYWLLLQNFAPVLGWNFYGDYLTDYLPVLVWNFYGDCLTNCVRLMAFAAKVCTSSPVKLLRWLPDWLSTTTGFCCETLHQFWCETFTVITWLTTYDLWFCCESLQQFWCETFTNRKVAK